MTVNHDPLKRTVRNMGGLVIFVLGISCPVFAFAQDPDETPTEILAVQVRKNGFSCDTPKNAKRDTEQSKPNEAVWVLECESGSYRIKMHGDMGSSVESLN